MMGHAPGVAFHTHEKLSPGYSNWEGGREEGGRPELIEGGKEGEREGGREGRRRGG